MTSNRDNSTFEKTSFLNGSNSAFIKELYLKYLENSKSIPQSWADFFEGLDEDQEIIKKEILGPSWAHKKNSLKQTLLKEGLTKENKLHENSNSNEKENYEKAKEQSVKAIALIRAYRIRGHLIANLDPLNLMERKYLHELHPADHGFKKEDYNTKISVHSYMDRNYSTINEDRKSVV